MFSSSPPSNTRLTAAPLTNTATLCSGTRRRNGPCFVHPQPTRHPLPPTVIQMQRFYQLLAQILQHLSSFFLRKKQRPNLAPHWRSATILRRRPPQAALNTQHLTGALTTPPPLPYPSPNAVSSDPLFYHRFLPAAATPTSENLTRSCFFSATTSSSSIEQTVLRSPRTKLCRVMRSSRGGAAGLQVAVMNVVVVRMLRSRAKEERREERPDILGSLLFG